MNFFFGNHRFHYLLDLYTFCIDHNSDHNRTGTDRTRERKTENGRHIPGQKSAESGITTVKYAL